MGSKSAVADLHNGQTKQLFVGFMAVEVHTKRDLFLLEQQMNMCQTNHSSR